MRIVLGMMKKSQVVNQSHVVHVSSAIKSDAVLQSPVALFCSYNTIVYKLQSNVVLHEEAVTSAA